VRSIGQKSLDLLFLFVSKAGGVLVVLFFMPLFYRLLGVEQFGVVAVILSLQAFLVMLDLGMSTLVGRDIAAFGRSSEDSTKVWHNAEIVLSIFYLVILVVAAAWGGLESPAGLSGYATAAVAILFWLMILQNIGQVVLLATKSYKAASMIQLVGVLFRSIVTMLALQYIAATLEVFILSQLVAMFFQMLVTRRVCARGLATLVHAKFDIVGCKKLLKRGKPLVVFGLAGAAAMQLDKPIIASLISSTEVATYFLAVTFCMTPVAILAGPISQYFQPNLISLASQGDQRDIKELLSYFVVTMMLVTMLPSLVLWIYSKFWIGLWLHDAPGVNQVISYVSILLPGAFIGALGFLPYAILTVQQDYRFQAMISLVMTIFVLLLVIYFANHHNVLAICWVYSLYHVASTAALWARSIYLSEMSEYAKQALIISIKLFVLFSMVASITKVFFSGVESYMYEVTLFMLVMLMVGGVSLKVLIGTYKRA